MPILSNKKWIATIAAIVTTLAILFNGAIFINTYYVSDHDFRLYKQSRLVAQWTFEESQNAIRVDMLEDRIYREKREDESNLDYDQIQKWRAQIIVLENRQIKIKENKEKIAIIKATRE